MDYKTNREQLLSLGTQGHNLTEAYLLHIAVCLVDIAESLKALADGVKDEN